ncbi:hypothetical protein MKW98_010577 [Papaver atlanticum]|uniref:Uncharacterized protein n=1 Tax=Papaver atlanticum TaxID=357466 RepID=A0AAD4X6N0_9MAGN|nr:hypothetical protein MKW98_010577 [Papaver atlanticum]
MFYLVIDIFYLISDLSLDFDLPYRRRVTHRDIGHLTTPSLQASSSAANMTKKILPVMKLEDMPAIFNRTDHTCAICLNFDSVPPISTCFINKILALHSFSLVTLASHWLIDVQSYSPSPYIPSISP